MIDAEPAASLRGYETPALLRWRRWTDVPLLVLAIGSLPFLLMELRRSSLSSTDRRVIDVVNLVVLVAFAVDYLVELALAARRRTFVQNEWTSLVIVVAQAISLLPGLSGFGVLRAARGARAFRAIAVVVRLIAVGGAAAREGCAVLRRQAAQFALALAGFTWLSSAACFLLAERSADHSIADALWWSIATITTVGYGDIYPVTPMGRIVGGFTMLVGISTFALVTAKVAEYLVRSSESP